jgi:hypothetical protein
VVYDAAPHTDLALLDPPALSSSAAAWSTPAQVDAACYSTPTRPTRPLRHSPAGDYRTQMAAVATHLTRGAGVWGLGPPGPDRRGRGHTSPKQDDGGRGLWGLWGV